VGPIIDLSIKFMVKAVLHGQSRSLKNSKVLSNETYTFEISVMWIPKAKSTGIRCIYRKFD